MGKRLLQLGLCLLAAVLIVMFVPGVNKNWSKSSLSGKEDQSSLIEQKIIQVNETPHVVQRMYQDDTYLGVLSDEATLDKFLKETYKEKYKEEFPDSNCHLGKNVYITHEQTYLVYENIDDQLIDYLDRNNLVTIKATEIELSNSKGVYAQFYVKNEQMYEAAMHTYLSYFIDPKDLAVLNNGQDTPPLKSYGSRTIGVSIPQNIEMQDAYIPPEQVKTTEDEVLEYLKYGDNKDRQYYTVRKNDTVAGVGAKNFGLSATQIMNINRDKIVSTDQVLEEGMELCVTYFTPPFDIIVSKERMKKEAIYFKPIYKEQPALRKGYTKTIQQGKDGSKNSLYAERWINGILTGGTLVSSVDTLQPVNEIMEVGTLEIPGVGTGTFRWPVDNPFISNGWLGYPGHFAIDIQNAYDNYGPLYASDRGVIETNSYNHINGNYVVINHNNGYKTYYGHLNVPSPLPVGTVVDKGDVIGQLGMTGWASGPHTHFFIMLDGVRKNPCEGYLPCYEN